MSSPTSTTTTTAGSGRQVVTCHRISCHSAELAVRELADYTLISAVGDIDAVNATDLADCARAAAGRGTDLLLDLRHLKFFGIEGFRALEGIDGACGDAGVRWAMVTSPAVTRVLRVCDRDGALPAAEDLRTAHGLLHRRRAPSLKLVAQAPQRAGQ
ncbi:STAS domain-containing protein [Mycolicibacterium palauense]|uniref:STAS domain-containing protein n=1 Tax=Mycolicibacterium palauense TaxID=2034511 RepID=UPI0011454B69|nr:STAS domain-containing protein [Mycolicibacterium palauense]